MSKKVLVLSASPRRMDCLDHVKEAEHIIGYEAWNKGDIVGNPAVEKAYQAGKNI